MWNLRVKKRKLIEKRDQIVIMRGKGWGVEFDSGNQKV